VGEDGPTHQGIFDINLLKTAPNLVIMAPKDKTELECMLAFAVNLDRAVAIRYPKAFCPSLRLAESALGLGKAQVLKSGDDFAVIALGSMVVPCFEAIELLEKEGLKGTLINARFAKPVDSGLFESVSAKVKLIFTVEDGLIDGGFGSAVSEAIHRPVIRMGLPCEFITHGKRDILLEKYGLTKEGIARRIREGLRKNG
jgi:1-deoxy-D-xylulose-5-phosphate synthase